MTQADDYRLNERGNQHALITADGQRLTDSGPLHWHLETLISRDSLVFGHGTVFHQHDRILSVAMRFELDGTQQSFCLTAEAGKPTDALAKRYPGLTAAANAGFIVLGDCPFLVSNAVRLTLLIELENEAMCEVPLPPGLLEDANVVFPSQASNHATTRALGLLQRVWRTARRQGWRGCLAAAERWVNGAAAQDSTSAQAIVRRLPAMARPDITLWIDHEIGGGANHYRRLKVAEQIADGKTVLIFTFQLPTLRYQLLVQSGKTAQRHSVPGPDLLADLAKLIPIDEIIYSSAVTFPRPEQVPVWLAALKRSSGARLTLMLHDFYALCSSPFLLNDADAFCDLPDAAACRKCLQQTRQPFTALFPLRDLAIWRRNWRVALEAADSVSMHSGVTLGLLRRAYPEADLSRAQIAPYPTGHIRFKPMLPRQIATLSIAIVGNVGQHKGARIVHRLAAEIRLRGLNIGLTVIGVLDGQREPQRINCTGPYQPHDLPRLIREAGSNVVLLPSIYPETFSYVTHEIIALDLPLACFAIGAQAERVLSYDKGLVLSDWQAPVLLDELMAFHQRQYPAAYHPVPGMPKSEAQG